MTCARSHCLLVAYQTVMTCASLLLDLGQGFGLFLCCMCCSALPVVGCCVWPWDSLQGCEMVRGGASLSRDRGAVQMTSSTSCESQLAQLSWLITLVINPHVKHSLGPGSRPRSHSHVFTCLVDDSAGRGLKRICGEWFSARFFKTFLHIPIHSEAALGLRNENAALGSCTPKAFGLESEDVCTVFSQEIREEGPWRAA